MTKPTQRKPRPVYTISAGFEAGSMRVTTRGRLVATVWGKGSTLLKINESALVRAEIIAAALLQADLASKPGDLEKASTEALRDICECGLKAGKIWRPRVVAVSHEHVGWTWRDLRETAPADQDGVFNSERAALLDAINHYGIDPDYLNGR